MILPGMPMPVFTAAEEITVVSNRTSVNETIHIDSSAQPGDIAIWFAFQIAGLETQPSVWDFVASRGHRASDATYRVFRKTVEVGEPGSAFSCMTGTAVARNFMLILRPPEGATWGPDQSRTLDSPPGPHSHTITAGSPPYVAIAAARSTSSGVPVMSPSEDGTFGSPPTDYVKYRVFNGAAAPVDVDYDPGGNAFLITFRIGLL